MLHDLDQSVKASKFVHIFGAPGSDTCCVAHVEYCELFSGKKSVLYSTMLNSQGMNWKILKIKSDDW